MDDSIPKNNDLYKKVLKQYNSFMRELKDLNNMGINGSFDKSKYNDESNEIVINIYNIFKNKMFKICSNAFELTNYLVEIFYCEYKNSNKDILWNSFGEYIFNNVKIANLDPKFKDVAEILVNKFFLDLGEAQAIALSLQEKADYFLTDDLDARTAAGAYNIEAHGTVGIILRAFRENIINKKLALQKINELYTSSSLFITKDIIDQIVKSINEFKK